MCFGGNKAMGKDSVSDSQASVSSTTSKPKPKPKRRSAGRGSGANKTLKQFGQGVVSNISTDLKMGMATFGMNTADQAAKLAEMGYSPKAIDSYQARTAASKERLKEMMAKSNDNDDSSPAPKPAVTIGTGSGVGTGGGIPSTTAAIVNQPVETALSYQEQLAQNEIQRARQERTRRKAEALRRRLEGGRRGLSLLRRGGARGYA